MDNLILEVKNVSKDFPGVKALEDVSFSIKRGEIHCLVGENGAGKSTLIKILSGLYPFGSYTDGIVFDGKEIKFKSPNDSRAAGIATIYQELPMVDQMDITENICLGDEVGRFGIIDKQASLQKAKAAMQEIGLMDDPQVLVSELGMGEQQMVAIAKALSQKAKLLILDEPTAALSEEEAAKLLAILKELKAKGVTSIFISHRLQEIFDAADTITVLRDGKSINSFKREGLTEDELIRAMVGREVSQKYPRRERTLGRELLAVKNLNLIHSGMKKTLKDISFTLKQGEILGLTGLVGAGRTELVMSLFGLWGKIVSGEVYLDGRQMPVKNPAQTIAAGLGLVSEDRKKYGLILMEDVKKNISLPSLKQISQRGVINENKEMKAAEEYAHRLNIRISSVEQETMNLSGGNQQKVVFGKWLMTAPKVLIFDEPTRGIDVAAKFEIYRIINELVDQGIGTIIVSSDLPEIIGLCDRVLVMCDGRLTAELPIKEATQEKIMHYAIGGK